MRGASVTRTLRSDGTSVPVDALGAGGELGITVVVAGFGAS